MITITISPIVAIILASWFGFIAVVNLINIYLKFRPKTKPVGGRVYLGDPDGPFKPSDY